MKYEYIHEIDVPFEEKKFIYPDARIKLFKNLIDNYAVFIPTLKLEYAFLNFNKANPIDYLVLFKSVDVKTGQAIAVWDAPYLYSNKTIPAYRYIVRNGLHEQFFKFVTESACRMEWAKFVEFIDSNLCNLSTDPKSPLYWKRPENADTLVEAIVRLSMEYTPKPGAPGVRRYAHKKDLKEIAKEPVEG